MQSSQRSSINGIPQWLCSCTSQAGVKICSNCKPSFGKHLDLLSHNAVCNVPYPQSTEAAMLSFAQAYELVQGALVRWSEQQAGQRPPPTAVMVHGILGSRKNMQAYARRLVEVCKHPVSMNTVARSTILS